MRSKRKIIGIIIAFLLVVIPVIIIASISEPETESLASDVNESDSTKENFIKSLAELKKISYDEAERQHELAIQKAIQDNPIESSNEIIKYLTIYENHRINSDIKLRMAVEVSFVYDKERDKKIQVIGVGNPSMDIVSMSSVSLYQFSHGGANVEYDDTRFRVSMTGMAIIDIKKGIKTIGISKENLTYSSNLDNVVRYYTTDVKTYVMERRY